MKKSTDELLNEIRSADSIDSYLSDNAENISCKKVSEMLENILAEKGLVKSEVIARSEVSQVYAYQIFSGVKEAPARDKVLSILIAMGLILDEVQSFLKLSGYPFLYAKNKRDSILIFCIENHKSVIETNNELYSHGEATL
ncbi:hypothetical protein RASY3_03965 [Ruminococcus albus SY3]|uniref:XRE family transcriptional regulator n=2 Tax=Ruminococcus albus TaxID=1264 RepID=A0A011UJK5_RUMAL|nr:hypothetical protein [Ruminococcus albus]EXM40844.1 hypothetical protein RASY3_03965 [Ruminococcus albus SY3]SEL41987.1 hypothetical protein SAMN05216469_12812 [Ruminococcus albus]